MRIYLNGDFVPQEEAGLSVTDYGFLFGYAIFETMHAYDGSVFRLKSHISRLAGSLSILEIPIEPVEIEDAVKQTVRINNLGNARVRLTVSAGRGSPVVDLGSCEKPTVVIIALPHTPMPPEIYAKGYNLTIAQIRRNSQSIVQSIKKTDYLESLLARRDARRSGADDALFLNEKGNVAEGTTSNVFVVKDDILKTPSLASGILPGITRDAILEIASQMNIRARETDISSGELLSANEVFLTGSIMEVMPVTQIDAQTIGNGRPGTVTRKLAVAFKDLVRKETRTG